MTEKYEEKIAELEKRMKRVDDLFTILKDELEHGLNMINKVEEIIAAWNDRFPDDPIYVPQRRRPASDYIMNDDEWKERTRIPHPRNAPKKFNPATGVWE